MISEVFERVQPIENMVYYAEAICIHNEDVLPTVKRGDRKDFEIGTLIVNDENKVKKESFTFLKLYIYEIGQYKYIDIRKELQDKYPDRKLDIDFLKEIKRDLPKKIKAQFSDDIWIIVDYDKLFENLK